ncbi:MAG TPA: hypothetical protein VIH75_08725 [Candidatus Sulfotelmatobacter sp.]|jgi:hypothetical protein
MRRIGIILGTAALILAVLAGWQIGACELANMNLQEDLRDLASQAGIHVGFVTPTSDEDVSLAVIRKAKDHGIELKPTQVTVRRTNPGPTSTLYLAADYTVTVNLLFVSFNLHFTPSSDKKGM